MKPFDSLLCSLAVALRAAAIAAAVGTIISEYDVVAQPKFFGSIWQWSSAADAPENFAALFNQTTPENAGKWARAEQSRGNFNWTTLDAMYAWADSNSALVKQHTFVWGQQEPGWIGNYTNSDTVKAIVRNWITTYLKRYGPKIDMIDVVNEPLHAPPSYRDYLGGSGATGWDWVVWTFGTTRDSAQKYAPQAKLLLNDYSIISSNGATTNYLAIINILKDRGLIDGIGEQCHFYESTDTAVLHANLNRLAATGLPIYISEFDVDDANDAGQLATYLRLFSLVWEHPAVEGVTLWGYQQNRIWRGNAYLYRTDGTERPACTWLLQYLKDHSTGTVAENVLYATARIKTAPARIMTFNLCGQRINNCAEKTAPALILRPGENRKVMSLTRMKDRTQP